jgi:hypothetical protein
MTTTEPSTIDLSIVMRGLFVSDLTAAGKTLRDSKGGVWQAAATHDGQTVNVYSEDSESCPLGETLTDEAGKTYTLESSVPLVFGGVWDQQTGKYLSCRPTNVIATIDFKQGPTHRQPKVNTLQWALMRRLERPAALEMVKYENASGQQVTQYTIKGRAEVGQDKQAMVLLVYERVVHFFLLATPDAPLLFPADSIVAFASAEQKLPGSLAAALAKLSQDLGALPGKIATQVAAQIVAARG